ncbi:hypothetical protein [Methylobacterium soli]|uniref:Uncharacterized protein n=1 Tax=Methylobacterium soli TaxID=553447 RepID=A0A6L3T1S2_9HYPH|nr:hypothetical protein [Methylobacterium soli]KAB1080561.1 hypothetical protein F6X53_05020 [Methylobacterium soli]GJE44925.1 hypothetical protein AEGHOMDF_4118 [Methylobacterium soli]
MRIGVYSDDMAGLVAALLLARGLATLGEPVQIMADLPAEVRSLPCENVRWPGAASMSDEAIERAVEGAADPEGHLVVVLPLARLANCRVRRTLDTALTAGRDHPASARALRAARYETNPSTCMGAAEASDRLPPPWFVPCSHQADLRTRATLASTGAVSLPFATRAIPFMVPRLGPNEVVTLAAPELPAATLQTGVLLASIVLAIAADPHAQRIDAAGLASLMATRDLEGERQVSDRLLALAAEFERLDAPVAQGKIQRASLPPSRRPLQASSHSSQLQTRRADSASSRDCFRVR